MERGNLCYEGTSVGPGRLCGDRGLFALRVLSVVGAGQLGRASVWTSPGSMLSSPKMSLTVTKW